MEPTRNTGTRGDEEVSSLTATRGEEGVSSLTLRAVGRFWVSRFHADRNTGYSGWFSATVT